MYFIDIQGTLIDDKNKNPIDGAVEFLNYLNQTKTPFILVTNNSKQNSLEFQNYLKSLEFEFDNYIDPLMILDDVLPKNIAVYGANELLNTLEKKGFILDYSSPKAVLISVKEYSFDEFSEIIEFLLNGVKLIGIHKTTLYSTGDNRFPGSGAILEMLKFATNINYEIIGKPSEVFYEKARDILNTGFEKITIISDDVKGDLIEAKKLGMNTVFVLSGKYRDEEEIIPFLQDDEKPDEIYRNIGEYYATKFKK